MERGDYEFGERRITTIPIHAGGLSSQLQSYTPTAALLPEN
jgi:hypothetical protein